MSNVNKKLAHTVFKYGASKSPDEILKNATGEKFNPPKVGLSEVRIFSGTPIEQSLKWLFFYYIIDYSWGICYYENSKSR